MENMLVNDVDCAASIMDLVDMHNDHVDKMNVLEPMASAVRRVITLVEVLEGCRRM